MGGEGPTLVPTAPRAPLPPGKRAPAPHPNFGTERQSIAPLSRFYKWVNVRMTNQQASLPRCAAVYLIGATDMWLPYSVASVYSAVEAIYMALPARSARGPRNDTQALREYLRSLPDPDHKIRLIEGNWTGEAKARNYVSTLAARDGFTHCLAIESDEIYHADDLVSMRRFIATHPETSAFSVRCRTYWKALRFRVTPFERDQLIAFTRSDRPVFTDGRTLDPRMTVEIPETAGVCHHMAFAHTEREMAARLADLKTRARLVPRWYEEVWLGWDQQPGRTNLHPVDPSLFHHATECTAEDLPPILRRLYERDPDFPLAASSPLRARVS